MNANERVDHIAQYAMTNLGEHCEEAVLVYRNGDDIVIKSNGYRSRILGLTIYAAKFMELQLLAPDISEDNGDHDRQ